MVQAVDRQGEAVVAARATVREGCIALIRVTCHDVAATIS